MKRILLALAVTFGMSMSAIAEEQKVVLSPKNTIVVHGVMTNGSMAKVSQQLLEMSKKLSPTDTIYLYLNTPGGSVDAGLEFINVANSIPQEVKTVTNFAASMGFITVQSLGERLITSTGVLMAHRAFGGEEGFMPGELNVRVAFWTARIIEIEKVMAKRLGLTLEQYQALRQTEYWVQGNKALNDNVADRIVSVSCSKELVGSYEESVMTLFGPVKVTFSSCPLIGAPLKIDMGQVKFEIMSTKDKIEFFDMINNQYTENGQFFRKYILTNKFKEIFN